MSLRVRLSIERPRARFGSSLARPSARFGSALLLALGLGCGKSDYAPEAPHGPASEHAETEHSARPPHKGLADVPELETPAPSADYDPSPSELPLTEDFAKAAETRVTPDNYPLQLATIERELEQLAPKPPKSAPGRASEESASRRPTPLAPKQAASARGVARK